MIVSETVVEQIAKIAHQTMKAYSETLDDYSQINWEELTPTQQQMVRDAVNNFLVAVEKGTILDEKNVHNNWMEARIKEGWTYGETKSYINKTDPMLVPFSQVPAEQTVKYKLLRKVIFAFID
jgi:hypothetical protein